jgi:hypothetical protein
MRAIRIQNLAFTAKVTLIWQSQKKKHRDTSSFSALRQKEKEMKNKKSQNSMLSTSETTIRRYLTCIFILLLKKSRAKNFEKYI